MTLTRRGIARTKNASRYVLELCKHWSHDFNVVSHSTLGVIHLLSGVAIVADAGSLKVRSRPAPDSDGERLQKVFDDHINRFAVREAPLRFNWTKEEVAA
jgi:hypothetical protein